VIARDRKSKSNTLPLINADKRASEGLPKSPELPKLKIKSQTFRRRFTLMSTDQEGRQKATTD